MNETLPSAMISVIIPTHNSARRLAEALSSALFRRSAFAELEGFDESLPAREDYDFNKEET